MMAALPVSTPASPKLYVMYGITVVINPHRTENMPIDTLDVHTENILLMLTNGAQASAAKRNVYRFIVKL